MSRAQPTSFKKRYSGGHFEPIKNARVGTQAEVEGETTKKQGVEPPLKEKKVTKTQKNTKKHKKTPIFFSGRDGRVTRVTLTKKVNKNGSFC